MNYSKKIDTLVPDIYNLLDNLNHNKDLNITKEIADEFGSNIAKALIHWASPRK